MNIQIDKDIAELYVGKWLFSYCLDYRLSITYKDGYLKVRMYDILRKEHCVLKLISASNYYISFWMDSSWFSCKIRIFPKIKNKIGVEFFDWVDFYKSRKKIKSDNYKHNIVVEKDMISSKFYGVWIAEEFEYIIIEPMDNYVSISLYSDMSPSRRKILLEKSFVYYSYSIMENSIEFITKGNEFNKTQDKKISFLKDKLILSYSRMVEVTQEIKNARKKNN